MRFDSPGQWFSALACYQRGQSGGDFPHREFITRSNRFDEYLAAGSDEARESSDPLGGFLAPKSFATELLQRVWNNFLVPQRCRRLTVTGQSLEAPLFHETSRADGSRLGGVQSFWRPETQTITSSKPGFKQLHLRPKFRVVLIPCTEELAMDAPLLEETIFSAASEEIGFGLTDAIVSGSGIGEPTGIVGSPATISVAKDTGQPAATISRANITAMFSRLWPHSDVNACWLASKSAQAAIIDNDDFKTLIKYAGPEAPAGIPRMSLLGCPMISLEQCQPVGTVGDVILADLSQYALGDKGDPEMVRSAEVRFAYHESMFKIVMRIDGAATWAAAVQSKYESFTQSPFITLATRS